MNTKLTLTVLSKLRKIVGSVKLPEDFDEEKELSSYYENSLTKEQKRAIYEAFDSIGKQRTKSHETVIPDKKWD